MLQADDLAVLAAVVRDHSLSKREIARTAWTISGDERPLAHQLSYWLSVLDRMVWLKLVTRMPSGEYQLTGTGHEAAKKQIERLRTSIKQCAIELQLNYW